MSQSGSNDGRVLIHAAGGLVLGHGENHDKIAIVHRRRYPGEIGLPKGKVNADENAEQTAQREVKEETGYEVKILRHAGTTHYFVGAAPKAVSYFVMQATSEEQVSKPDAEEIESVEFVTPRQAVQRLTHREDRELVREVFDLAGRGKT